MIAIGSDAAPRPGSAGGTGLVGTLRMLSRHARGIAVSALVVTGVALGLSMTATPQYSATAALFFSLQHGNSATDLAQGVTYTRDQLASYAALAQSPAVLRPVIDQLGLDSTPAALAGRVSATAATETVVLDVTATSSSATESARIANAVAAQLTTAVMAVAPTDTTGRATVRVTPVTPATPPAHPSSPRTLLNVISGLLGGLLLGVLYAALREALDSRVRDASRVEALTDVPVLGRLAAVRVRETGQLTVADAPGSSRAEQIRQLRTNLEFLRVESEPFSFVVTSAMPAEGKSTVAANLAIAFAEVYERVLLIDADLRRPTVAQRLDLEGAAGLSTVLIGRAEFDDVVQEWGANGLHVLTAGAAPPNPVQLLDSPRMVQLLERLENRYDVIVIDSAPVLPVTDAVLLARRARGVLLVADTRRVRRHEFVEALRQLGHGHTRVLGIVLNRAGNGRQTYGYGAYASADVPGASTAGPVRRAWPRRVLPRRSAVPAPPSPEDQDADGVAPTPAEAARR